MLLTILSAIWAGFFVSWFTATNNNNISDRHQRSVGVVLMVLFVLGASIVANKPTLASDDVYRYQWDGWVTVNGVNPYNSLPSDSSLAHLTTTSNGKVLPAQLPYNSMKTIYPPGAQALFAGIALIFGTDLYWWGLTWLVFVGVGLGAVVRLSDLNVPQKNALIFITLSPLVLIHGIADIHLDILCAGLMFASFVFAKRNYYLVAGLLLGIGVTIKYVPIIAIIYLFVNASTKHRKELVGGSLLMIAILYAPFIGSDLLGNAPNYLHNWEANAGLFGLLRSLTNRTTALLVLAPFVASLLVWIFVKHKHDAPRATALSVIAILLCSPVVHAWYLLPAVLLFPLAPLRASIAWVATSVAYTVVAITYQRTGMWVEHPVWLLAEHVPVWLLFFYDLTQPIRGRFFESVPVAVSRL